MGGKKRRRIECKMIFELFDRKENETKEKNFLFDWIENRRKKSIYIK